MDRLPVSVNPHAMDMKTGERHGLVDGVAQQTREPDLTVATSFRVKKDLRV